MLERKVALVTGTSSGIGQAIARLLAQQGFSVFGTSRDPSDVETTAGVQVLSLNVCRDESVNACVEAVVKQTGRLDVLINNAGYALRGAIEETSLEEAQAQFETNFWGVVRMVRAVLPIMRRQGNGQIINISSAVGVVAPPFEGFYAASKFALEGYTEALRHEVKPFKIQVSLVEPSVVKTQFLPRSQFAARPIREYTPWRERALAAIRRHADEAPQPARVAECVLSIITAETPRLRYEVGEMAARLLQARRSLPEEQLEQAVRSALHLDAAQQEE